MASRPTSETTAQLTTTVSMNAMPATLTNQATTTTTTTAAVVLKKRTPALNHYMGASTPIAAHYQLNTRILYAFDVHYQFKRYQVAHALGLQFVETALLEIPKHGYYYSNRHERERGESIRQAQRVLKLLNKIPTKDNRKKSTSSIPSNQHSSSQSPTRNQQQQQQSYGIPSSVWDLTRLQKLQDLALAAQHVQNNKSHHKSQSIYEKKREAVEQALWGHPPPQGPPSCPPLEQKPLTKAMVSVASAKTKLLNSMIDSSNVSTTTRTTGMTTGAWSADDALLQKALFLSGLEIVPSSSQQPLIVEAETYEDDGDYLYNLSEYDEDKDLQRTIAQEIKEGSHVSVAFAAKTAAAQWLWETTTSTSGNTMADIAVAQQMVQEMSAMADDSHTQKASSPIFQSGLWPHRRGKATTKFSHAAWELDTLCQMYRDDFDSLLVVLDDESSLSSSSLSLSSSSSSTLSFSQDPRIQIRYCPTYQGRLSGSTNGCTVIASLLCIHHLCQQHQKPRVGHSSWRSSNNHRGFFPNFAAADGLHNKTIQQVIDKETPIMLQQVRKSLGLPDHAFLIPADVHDYLIAHGRLHRSQFVTVVGGNVLNDWHLDNFVSTLAQFGDTNEMNGIYPTEEEKVAATLFFNEHVVAIIKITPRRRQQQQKQGQHDTGALSSCYDVIDSLPERTTVRRALPPNNNTSSSTDSLDSTAIYRCSNAEALKACLRWYACSKFTKANRHYINNYEWNDHGIISHDDTTSNSNCFDPRIFQAFIWKNPPAQ